MCVTNTINRRPKAIALKGCPVETPTSNATSSSQINRQASAPAVPQHSANEFAASRTFATYNHAYNNVNVNVNASAPVPAPSSFDWNTQFVASMPIQYSYQPESKPVRPKRRRKPQKPGKTAKMNDRHFVVHNYHDHAKDQPNEVDVKEQNQSSRRRGGVSLSFPLKLHAMLDQIEADGLGHVISWQPHGRAFLVHKPQEFASHVMPTYFRQTKLTSFQRQLNLYGFCRLTRGNDNRGYYHELFLRGKPFLCKQMVRTKVKGTKFKAASSPEAEPDFYRMPPVVITPPTSGASDQSDTESVDSTRRDSESLMHSPVASFDAPVPTPDDVFAMTPMSPISPLRFREIQQPHQEPPPPIPSLYQVPIVQQQQQRATAILSDEEQIHDDFLNSIGMDFVKTWGREETQPVCDAEEILEVNASISDDYQLGCLLEQFIAD